MNLLLELLEAIGLASPAVERHVPATGGSGDDGSAKTPSRTIKRAIEANAARPAGQELSIALHGAPTESVTLPSNVTLEGVHGATVEIRVIAGGRVVKLPCMERATRLIASASWLLDLTPGSKAIDVTPELWARHRAVARAQRVGSKHATIDVRPVGAS